MHSEQTRLLRKTKNAIQKQAHFFERSSLVFSKSSKISANLRNKHEMVTLPTSQVPRKALTFVAAKKAVSMGLIL